VFKVTERSRWQSGRESCAVLGVATDLRSAESFRRVKLGVVAAPVNVRCSGDGCVDACAGVGPAWFGGYDGRARQFTIWPARLCAAGQSDTYFRDSHKAAQVMDKKAKKKIDILNQRLKKLRVQLAGARRQMDDNTEVELLEKQIDEAKNELEKLKTS